MDLRSIYHLFLVSFMPILQVLIISGLGAFMASQYLGLLPVDARKSLNKIVFTIFTPSLTFASLAKTVNFQDILSWWFMPINVGLTFFFGAILGEGLLKLVEPKAEIKGLVIAFCSAANLGNLVLILIPAICRQDGSPFGEHVTCKSIGLSYTAFSMALGGLYMWTITYHLLRKASMEYKKSQEANEKPNNDVEADQRALLLDQLALNEAQRQQYDWTLKELMAPPTIGAILGLIFGTVPWFHHLIVGDHAWLRVIPDCTKLLGRGTIPCITLIMGGNLREGFRSGKLEKSVILGVIAIKYVLLPLIGLGVVSVADKLGFLPPDPLYHFILMVQFTLPLCHRHNDRAV